MKEKKISLKIAGLAALLSMPVLAQDLEQTCSNNHPEFKISEGRDGHYNCDPAPLEKSLTVTVPESCNGWAGSQRQARFDYDGSANGYDFFVTHMDCLPEPAAWTFVDFYNPFTGDYEGSLGANTDYVSMFLEEGSETRVRMVVSSYDAYDPQTGTYGNLLGRDEILRFTSMNVPPLVDDTDGGDSPHIPGFIEVYDWTGHRFWPDYALDEHNMVEMYRRGPAHLQDETNCEEVLVNGLPVQYWDWPAECTNLFQDGFESGDLSAWSSHTVPQSALAKVRAAVAKQISNSVGGRPDLHRAAHLLYSSKSSPSRDG